MRTDEWRKQDFILSKISPIMHDEILGVFLEFVQEENHSVLLSSYITSDIEKPADYITFIHKRIATSRLQFSYSRLYYIIYVICAEPTGERRAFFGKMTAEVDT